MRTNRAAIVAQSQSRERDQKTRRSQTCVICIAARVFLGAALVLGIVYAPNWVGKLTAWYFG
ncbi:MAG TPA: hypothetical protein VMF12_07415 [Xanthobacteraceae bacterium]|nr:hypothetical protein [Xanthobacteraceae bacterium]